MKNKFLGSLIAIAFSLLSIFGYQWATNGSPPDVEKFLNSATCKANGTAVTITAQTGEKIVVSFPPTYQTTQATVQQPDNMLYYDVPKKGQRAVPISLLNYLDKYRGIINLARDCLISSMSATDSSPF